MPHSRSPKPHQASLKVTTLRKRRQAPRNLRQPAMGARHCSGSQTLPESHQCSSGARQRHRHQGQKGWTPTMSPGSREASSTSGQLHPPERSRASIRRVCTWTTGLMQFGACYTKELIARNSNSKRFSRVPVTKEGVQCSKAIQSNFDAFINGAWSGPTAHTAFGAEMTERVKISMGMAMAFA